MYKSYLLTILYALFLHCLRSASCSLVIDAPDTRLELVMAKEFSFSGRSGGSVSLTTPSSTSPVCMDSMGARVTFMPTVVTEPLSWS